LRLRLTQFLAELASCFGGVVKNRLSAFAALATVMATSAMAADIPLKAPPPAAYGWAGFYLGVNAGYGLGSDPFTQADVSATFGPELTSSIASRATPQGGLFGGQMGYNWQTGHVVYGVEGDIQWSHQTDTAGCGLVCGTGLFSGSAEILGSAQQTITWFGTARGRLGWANDGWLFYVTGGGAWGGINATTAVSNTSGPVFAGSETTQLTKGGWAFGGGTEVRIGGPWTAKVEYLYVDLGNITDTLILPPAVFGTSTLTTSSSIHDQIIRAGLNYKWDQAPVPGMAPPSVYRWTGFYLGVNGGYGLGSDPFGQTATEAGFGPVTVSSIDSRVTPQGGLFGGQLGYNWQSGHVVYGVEGDIQWSNQTDTAGCGLDCNTSSTSTDTFGNVKQTISWFGTARGRLGWADDGWLLYVTGGGAWGGISASTSVSDTFPPAFAASDSNQFVKSGWVFGGGSEFQIAGPWTAKFEYLYMDLGNVTDTFVLPPPPFGAGATLSTTSSIHDHIIRAGLNYKLN
jgi:outer membrane immunogenic protein